MVKLGNVHDGGPRRVASLHGKGGFRILRSSVVEFHFLTGCFQRRREVFDDQVNKTLRWAEEGVEYHLKQGTNIHLVRCGSQGDLELCKSSLQGFRIFAQNLIAQTRGLFSGSC